MLSNRGRNKCIDYVLDFSWLCFVLGYNWFYQFIFKIQFIGLYSLKIGFYWFKILKDSGLKIRL